MVDHRYLPRPFVKWAGGKRQLLPEILGRIPPKFQVFYEPFVGGGAVLFGLQPCRAVINDFNVQLILTYQAIREDIDHLIELLQKHKSFNSKSYYYAIRELDRNPSEFALISDTEKAARLIYLNKTCYNGLYRVNSQGMFNVPYGTYKNPGICEQETLQAIHDYLVTCDITMRCGDFADAVRDACEDDFVYFDPPYHSPDKMNFTGYQADGFNEAEQQRLRDVFSDLTAKKVKCLLSNSDTPFIRSLFQDYRVETVQAIRAINSVAEGRGKVNELLIRNW